MTPRLERFQEDFHLRFGTVERQLGNLVHDTGNLLVSPDAFVMQPNARIALRYDRGKGVVCEHLPDVSPAEVALWFNGFARGLAAWLNGLTVLHASAVSRQGRTIALTGPSGAGKSTIAAGLAKRGWSVLEDDALIIDWCEEGAIALSGRSELRLWDDTFGMVGLRRGAEVEHRGGKFVAATGTESVRNRSTQLRDIVVLEFGAADRPIEIVQMDAASRLSAIKDVLFRDYLVSDVLGRKRYGEIVLQVIEGAQFHLLRRPKARGYFERSLDVIEQFSTETTDFAPK